MLQCSWQDSVLIETLWNVNISKNLVEPNESAVLIETLWNVNTEDQTGTSDHP